MVCALCKWRWREEGDVSKLLGTPFGIDVDTKNIGEFLVGRLRRKVRYWYMMHFPLVGKVLVINSIFASSFWFFFSVWASSKKAIQRWKIILHNYLWAIRKINTRTIVKWKDCCVRKKVDGLALTNLKNIFSSFLCKWVMLA
jgi:hypothetical protein